MTVKIPKAVPDWIAELKRHGISVEISCKGPPARFGAGSYRLPLNEIEEYSKDPMAFWAKREGVSRETLVEYMENDFEAKCGALTQKGQLCKRNVAGQGWGYCSDPRLFRDLHRQGCCELHEEKQAA
jgi:hypothetical protein